MLLGTSRTHGFSLDVRAKVQTQTRLLPGTHIPLLASSQEPSLHACLPPRPRPHSHVQSSPAQLPVSFLHAALPSTCQVQVPSSCHLPGGLLNSLPPDFSLFSLSPARTAARELFLEHNSTLPILC